MGKIYIGVNDVAKQIKTPYIGVGGVAKKVKKIYLGVNGVAKKVWQSGKSPMSGVTTLVTSVGDRDVNAQIFGSSDYADAIAQGHSQIHIHVEWSVNYVASGSNFNYDYGVFKQNSQTDPSGANLIYVRTTIPTAPGTYTFTYDDVVNLSDLTYQEIWINSRTPSLIATATVTWSIEFI